jgi:hypothetical protein
MPADLGPVVLRRAAGPRREGKLRRRYPHLLGHQADCGLTQLAAPAPKPHEPAGERQQQAEGELGRPALPGWFALPVCIPATSTASGLLKNRGQPDAVDGDERSRRSASSRR